MWKFRVLSAGMGSFLAGILGKAGRNLDITLHNADLRVLKNSEVLLFQFCESGIAFNLFNQFCLDTQHFKGGTLTVISINCYSKQVLIIL
jgi:hypothetical protein